VDLVCSSFTRKFRNSLGEAKEFGELSNFQVSINWGPQVSRSIRRHNAASLFILVALSSKLPSPGRWQFANFCKIESLSQCLIRCSTIGNHNNSTSFAPDSITEHATEFY